MNFLFLLIYILEKRGHGSSFHIPTTTVKKWSISSPSENVGGTSAFCLFFSTVTYLLGRNSAFFCPPKIYLFGSKRECVHARGASQAGTEQEGKGQTDFVLSAA